MSVFVYLYAPSPLFFWSYDSKRLLQDSITRTLHGIASVCDGAVLSGCRDIVLARIESVAACAFIALSAVFFTINSVLILCVFIPALPLNLMSRIPGAASLESVQNFTRTSNRFIFRTFRVHFIGAPVFLLFLSAASTNVFLPGLLKEQNLFFSSIHRWVEPLGELRTTRVVVSPHSIEGTKKVLGPLEAIEEFLRTLSCENDLKEETPEPGTVIIYRSSSA